MSIPKSSRGAFKTVVLRYITLPKLKEWTDEVRRLDFP